MVIIFKLIRKEKVMKNFMYYCDPGIKWIDVTEIADTIEPSELETTDLKKAIDFAKLQKCKFVGYSETERKQADLLNQQLESK